MSPRRVTLLSDFGTADGYAAAMAGVIAAAAPSAAIEHASHAIPPGDILSAALTLSRYAFLYPPGTVHLVVVDPGVGTERRAIAAAVDGRFFVAPDNGVLTRVLRQALDVVVIELDPRVIATDDSISTTFHGRDLFAPAAGRLARDEPLHTLGSEATDPVLLELPEPRRAAGGISGEVIQVDRYGNLITNIPLDPSPPAGSARPDRVDGLDVLVEGRSVGPIRRTYGQVESGALVAVVGSLGLLEVSVRDGSAADRLRAGRGTPVTVVGVSSRATPGPRD